MLPVLTYTLPRAAADALRWRASTLDLARDRAGAARPARARRFPWRTIRGAGVLGVLAGRHRRLARQRRHRRGVRALPRRHRRRGSGGGLRAGGAGRDGAAVALARATTTATGVWHIDGVTGPDEYTAVVRDNVFTNLMAAHNLRSAAAGVRPAPGGRPRALGVTTEETAAWRDAADGRAHAVRRGARRARAVRGLHRAARVGLRGQRGPLPAAAARAVRPAVPRAGDQAGRPGAGDALAGPRVHPRAEGAQRRLLRAADGARLLPVGVHPGGDVRRGGSPASWPTTTPTRRR